MWIVGASVFTSAAKAAVSSGSFRRPKGLLHPVTAGGCSVATRSEGVLCSEIEDRSGSDVPKGMLDPVTEAWLGEDAETSAKERPFRAASRAFIDRKSVV